MAFEYLLKAVGIVKEDFEYWVPLEQIVIPDDFKRSRIREAKWRKKKKYFRQTGELESKILVRRSDWMLVDGYSSYKIAKEANMGKVPVYFVN